MFLITCYFMMKNKIAVNNDNKKTVGDKLMKSEYNKDFMKTPDESLNKKTDETTNKKTKTPENKAIGQYKLNDVKYWAYLLDGDYTDSMIQKIVNSKYDMVVLEPTRTSKGSYNYNCSSMVNRVKESKGHDGKRNKIAIAYISIGEAEEWRWYWDSVIADTEKYNFLVADDPEGWEGGVTVAYWKKAWKDIIIYGSEIAKGQNFRSSIDQAINDGFDGIYLDWVEGYSDEEVLVRAKSDGVNAKREMIKFLSEIRTYCNKRKKGFYIIQQNASSIVEGNDEPFSYVDAIAQEAVWYDGTAFDEWAAADACDIKNSSGLTSYYIGNLKRYLKKRETSF